MHLHTDEEISSLRKHELLHMYKERNLQLPADLSVESLRASLKNSERTRTIGIWHDHAAILGKGYTLVTAKVFYDRANFRTNSEIDHTYQPQNIQAHNEEPEIHILAISSSSTEDQAALVGDRVKCIMEMSTELYTRSNIPIRDRLMLFCGDKPAAQSERGTRIRGHYPCRSCGADVRCMDDCLLPLEISAGTTLPCSKRYGNIL